MHQVNIARILKVLGIILGVFLLAGLIANLAGFPFLDSLPAPIVSPIIDSLFPLAIAVPIIALAVLLKSPAQKNPNSPAGPVGPARPAGRSLAILGMALIVTGIVAGIVEGAVYGREIWGLGALIAFPVIFVSGPLGYVAIALLVFGIILRLIARSKDPVSAASYVKTVQIVSLITCGIIGYLLYQLVSSSPPSE